MVRDRVAVAEYVEAAGRLPTFLARPRPRPGAGAEPVGALLLERHFPAAAEIHLLAVERSWHRRGVGRALVEAAERSLVADGVKLLSVKTLGPSHPDEAYAATRLFYAALGFLPVEELADLWPGNPCLIMVKPLGPAGEGQSRSTGRSASSTAGSSMVDGTGAS